MSKSRRTVSLLEPSLGLAVAAVTPVIGIGEDYGRFRQQAYAAATWSARLAFGGRTCRRT